MRAAVLVIEMQNEFVTEGFPFYIGEMAKTMMLPLQKLLDAARHRKVPVVYCNMVPIKEDALFKKFPTHVVPGTPGAEVADEIKPKDEDYIVPIYAMDAFLHSTLERVLRNLGADTVIIAGETTEVGCLITAMGAFQRGLDVVLVSDCCASWNEEKHQMGLKYLKPFTKVLKSAEVIDLL